MDQIKNLIGLMMGCQAVHHDGHWRCSGPSFRGDHELLGDLYKQFDDQIDTLAEKAILLYGDKAVDAVHLARVKLGVVEHLEHVKGILERSVEAEDGLTRAIDRAISEMGDDIDIGLDNYLRGLRDQHQRLAYQLGQRLKGG